MVPRESVARTIAIVVDLVTVMDIVGQHQHHHQIHQQKHATMAFMDLVNTMVTGDIVAEIPTIADGLATMAHVLVQLIQALVVFLVMLAPAMDMDHMVRVATSLMIVTKVVRMVHAHSRQFPIVTANSIKVMDTGEIVVRKKEIVMKNAMMANVLDHLSLPILIHQLILVPVHVLAVGVVKAVAKDLLVHAVLWKAIAVTLVMEMVFVAKMMVHGEDR
jgi:hypothetical protein